MHHPRQALLSFIFFSMLLLFGCSGGGGEDKPKTPAGSNNWDQMKWDQDKWS